MMTLTRNKFLVLLLSCLSVFLLNSCEENQRIREQGELIRCPVLEKFTKGNNNPNKTLSKRYYLRIHITPSGEKRAILVDQSTYKAANIGDTVQGYYLEGKFLLARQ